MIIINVMQNPLKEMSGFSPAKIVASPGSKVSQGKNLTGPPRLVQDNAADVFSCVQQWKKLYEHGVSIIKKIIHSKVDKAYPDELTSSCEDLENVCDQMDTIVESLRILADRMEKISHLPHTDGILFTTWPMKKYVSTVQQIYDAHKNEAAVKRIILENVAHDHRESVKVLHMAAWLYQPLLPDSIDTDLESLVVETRLRQMEEKSKST